MRAKRKRNLKEGKITFQEALKNADAANNLRLCIELGEKGDGTVRSGADTFNGLCLIEDPKEEEEYDEHFLKSLSVFAPPDVSRKSKQD